MSNVDLGAQSCPYCGKRFVNTNPAGALPAHSLLAGRYTIGRCLGLDGEGITYSAIDGKEMRRVTIKEYVPVSICAARGGGRRGGAPARGAGVVKNNPPGFGEP